MEIEDSIDPPNTLDHGKTTVNQYATKKTLAISSLEIALLTTNAVQLKTLLGHQTNRDTYWLVGLILVCASILIQIINVCLLIILGSCDLAKARRQHCLVYLNNFSLMLSVFINAINVALNVILIVEPNIMEQISNGTKIF